MPVHGPEILQFWHGGEGNSENGADVTHARRWSLKQCKSAVSKFISL
jgi:hypothetical protein